MLTDGGNLSGMAYAMPPPLKRGGFRRGSADRNKCVQQGSPFKESCQRQLTERSASLFERGWATPVGAYLKKAVSPDIFFDIMKRHIF
jgi:hypothetical protein